MKLSDKQILLEQLALLFASFVWTTVILAAIAAFSQYPNISMGSRSNCGDDAVGQVAADSCFDSVFLSGLVPS